MRKQTRVCDQLAPELQLEQRRLNRGCLPSRNLIEAAKIIHDARYPRYPGLTAAELGLDFRQLIEQKDEVIHGYRHKKYESLTGGQFSIEKGHVEFVDNHTLG